MIVNRKYLLKFHGKKEINTFLFCNKIKYEEKKCRFLFPFVGYYFYKFKSSVSGFVISLFKSYLVVWFLETLYTSLQFITTKAFFVNQNELKSFHSCICIVEPMCIRRTGRCWYLLCRYFFLFFILHLFRIIFQTKENIFFILNILLCKDVLQSSWLVLLQLELFLVLPEVSFE